jgi:beta-mannanase
MRSPSSKRFPTPTRRHFLRSVLFLAATAILVILTPSESSEVKSKNADSGPVKLVFPERGAYTGAYIDFGEAEDKVSLDAIEDFEKLIGKHQAIIASSSFWGEQTFPMKNLQIISRHGSLPMIYWSPWDRPYAEKAGAGRFSLQNILAGKCDAYIDHWADQARTFGKPILVSWGLEMNGDWFPWSGCFHGAGKKIGHHEPPRFEGPELFKKAFRYVVDRVRSRGAANIYWGFHVNNMSFPATPWNTMQQYYPGPDYVDWLAMSVYGKQFRQGDWWVTFGEVMAKPYQEICRVDPVKPVLLAEWGVGEYPSVGDKGAWIMEGFSTMKTLYPRIRGAVYWHERWQNEDDTYSNLRVNSSPAALQAYRKGVADPHWLDSPLFEAQVPRK